MEYIFGIVETLKRYVEIDVATFFHNIKIYFRSIFFAYKKCLTLTLHKIGKQYMRHNS